MIEEDRQRAEQEYKEALARKENRVNAIGQKMNQNAADFQLSQQYRNELSQEEAARQQALYEGVKAQYDQAFEMSNALGYANKFLGKVPALGKIKNPVVRNLVTGQAADTIVQTPRVITEGISDGKNAGEILTDVAKQQGEDLLWNLGSEAVGQVFKGGKKLLSNSREAKVKTEVIHDALTDSSSDVAKNFVHTTEGLSDDTITAIRKIQTIADTAGKDFSEVASAVVQKKTMKELRPEMENLVTWLKTNDSAGYIKRIDFDDAGKIRIDRGVK